MSARITGCGSGRRLLPARRAAPLRLSLAVPFAALLAASAASPAQDGAHKGAPASSSAAAASASSQRQRELQAEQRELKNKLSQLKKTLAKTESAHSEATDALAASESAISSVNRNLRELAAQRREVERRISELRAGQRENVAAQGTQSSQLGQALRGEYLQLAQPAAAAVVSPADSGRTLDEAAYLDAVARERQKRIGELRERQQALSQAESESNLRVQQLEHIDAQERVARAQLLKQEVTRRTTLARLAKDLGTQRQSVAKLERDDARLSTLIDEISRLLAEQAAKQRAQARARARAFPHAGKSPEAEKPELDVAQPPTATRFGRLQGKLTMPVSGIVGSKFGAARVGEDGHPQAGAPPWKGLFIRADAGAPVHAVAAGQVVFADWLRGFGNLMILDHGEGFLSVYAYNESLMHGVGDTVSADEVIASVGNTGGNASPGLYFEMRYRGRPFDPLGWVVPR